MTFQHWRDSPPKNQYKFQGQEHQPETGWDQYKWRNADPALGRFFNIDPLAEKFYYNSTYAFSENKVTHHVELEGLEAYDKNGQATSDNTTVAPNKATVEVKPAPYKPRRAVFKPLVQYHPGVDYQSRQIGDGIDKGEMIVMPWTILKNPKGLKNVLALAKNLKSFNGFKNSKTFSSLSFDGLRLLTKSDQAAVEGGSILKFGKTSDFVPTEAGSQSEGFVHILSEQIKSAEDWLGKGTWPHKPLSVVEVDGKRILLDGHHRFEAAKKAGFTGDIPYSPVSVEDSGYTLEQLKEFIK